MRRCRAGIAVVLGMVMAVVAIATSLLGQDQAPPAGEHSVPAPADAPELAGDALEEFQRRTLNALLVPLLGSDDPLEWVATPPLFPCADTIRVSVDGRDIAEGARLELGRPLQLRWTLVDCWPLGIDWMGLTGELEMTIVAEPGRIDAAIRPLQLAVFTAGARHQVTERYTGTLSLSATPHRP